MHLLVIFLQWYVHNRGLWLIINSFNFRYFQDLLGSNTQIQYQFIENVIIMILPLVCATISVFEMITWISFLFTLLISWLILCLLMGMMVAILSVTFQLHINDSFKLRDGIHAREIFFEIRLPKQKIDGIYNFW